MQGVLKTDSVEPIIFTVTHAVPLEPVQVLPDYLIQVCTISLALNANDKFTHVTLANLSLARPLSVLHAVCKQLSFYFFLSLLTQLSTYALSPVTHKHKTDKRLEGLQASYAYGMWTTGIPGLSTPHVECYNLQKEKEREKKTPYIPMETRC